MRSTLVLALLVLAAPLSATAQTSEVCEGPACTAAEPEGRACRLFFYHSDQALNRFNLGRGDRYNQETPDGCLQEGTVYGLQGFRMNWPGGHKVRRIQLTQSDGQFKFRLRDADGIDPATAFVWAVPLPPGTELHELICFSIGKICSPRVELSEPGQTIVIAGFDFDKVNEDGHLELIDIEHMPNGDVETNFADGENWEGSRRIVQYAIVDRHAFHSQGTAQGSYDGGGTGLLDPTDPGDAVLTNFRMKFENGGHFIEEFGLERHRNAYEAWFQDNQSDDDRRRPDDPFEWEAGYILLR